jgi:hypothetical protein
MVYKHYQHYCYACRKTIVSGLGVASHRRSKQHQENVAKAKGAGRAYWIERL